VDRFRSTEIDSWSTGVEGFGLFGEVRAVKRFCWMLGILAVLVASAPMTADAIRPPRQVAPIAPPGEIGDDDQPDKEAPSSGPGVESAPGQSQTPMPGERADRRAVRVWLDGKHSIPTEWILRLLHVGDRGRE